MRPANYWVYIGTYRVRGSRGIYACRFDARSGELSSPDLVGETPNPSFLAIDASERFLYTVNEAMGDQNAFGAVSAFQIDHQSGKLAFLNQVSSQGATPCHLSLDKAGKYVLVANYDSGSVAMFPRLEGGRLGEAQTLKQHSGCSVNPARQSGPHAHCVEASPDGHFALVADLGLDRLVIYRLDAQLGTLQPHSPPFATVHPGDGPRHLVFHPKGRFVYLLCEMGCRVAAFSYDERRGTLQGFQAISTLPEGFDEPSDAAEIQMDARGMFLYASNRGHESIAVFSVDQEQGMLACVAFVPTLGKTPRHFAFDPTGTYLFAANQNSDNVVLFRVDRATGSLTPADSALRVAAPACVAFCSAD
jgi:6-phosphogluconolactonase